MKYCGHDYWMATSIPVVSVGGAWIVEEKHLFQTYRVPITKEEADAAPRKVVYLHSSLECFSLARMHGPNEVSFHDDVGCDFDFGCVGLLCLKSIFVLIVLFLCFVLSTKQVAIENVPV